MTTEEIKNLGIKLGLSTCHTGKDYVNFDIGNAQRVIIYDHNHCPDESIYKQLGRALMSKGKILKKLEINKVLSITDSD